MTTTQAIPVQSPVAPRALPTRARRRGGDRRIAWGLAFIAALVAMGASWIPSLWGDEAASVLSAERPLPSLFRMLGHVDAVHGTYYLGLHFWIDAFGASPFSVRLPSALAAGVLVAGVYFLVRQLGPRRLAVAAAVAVTVIPRVTSFGEEARSYAFGAALAAWLLLILVRLVERRTTATRWWILYGIVLAAGIYTFLYFGLLVAVFALVLLSVRAPRAIVGRWAIATGAGILLASPVVVYGLAQHGQVGFLARRDTVNPTSVLVTTWFGSLPFAILAWALVAVAAAFFVADRIRDRRIAREQRHVSLTVVAVAWLLVPLVILLAGNVVVADFSPRYLSYSAPAAGILMAIGIVRLGGLLSRWRRAPVLATLVGLALVIGLAAPVYVSQRTPYAKNNTGWQSVSAVVGAHASSGDAVVFDESTRPSRRTRLALTTYPAGFAGLKDVTLETNFVDAEWWDSTAYTVPQALAKGRFDGVTRVWVVEYGSDDYGLAALKAAGFTQTDSFAAHNARVVELSR